MKGQEERGRERERRGRERMRGKERGRDTKIDKDI